MLAAKEEVLTERLFLGLSGGFGGHLHNLAAVTATVATSFAAEPPSSFRRRPRAPSQGPFPSLAARACFSLAFKVRPCLRHSLAAMLSLSDDDVASGDSDASNASDTAVKDGDGACAVNTKSTGGGKQSVLFRALEAVRSVQRYAANLHTHVSAAAAAAAAAASASSSNSASAVTATTAYSSSSSSDDDRFLRGLKTRSAAKLSNGYLDSKVGSHPGGLALLAAAGFASLQWHFPHTPSSALPVAASKPSNDAPVLPPLLPSQVPPSAPPRPPSTDAGGTGDYAVRNNGRVCPNEGTFLVATAFTSPEMHLSSVSSSLSAELKTLSAVVAELGLCLEYLEGCLAAVRGSP